MARPYLLDNAELWIGEHLDVLDVNIARCRVRWDRRYRNLIAKAHLFETDAEVRLSSRLYPRLKPLRRIEVIAHEVCHLAVWHHVGDVEDEHGEEWREFMRRLGYTDASAFMQVD